MFGALSGKYSSLSHAPVYASDEAAHEAVLSEVYGVLNPGESYDKKKIVPEMTADALKKSGLYRVESIETLRTRGLLDSLQAYAEAHNNTVKSKDSRYVPLDASPSESTSQEHESNILSPTRTKDLHEANLFVARSWIEQWHPQRKTDLEKNPEAVFFERATSGNYIPARSFHFDNLILGGKFPVLQDHLGGLDPSDTAVMDVLDPSVQKIDHVHINHTHQVLTDINVITDKEASYLRGENGIKRVLQSNIGGPKESLTSLEEVARQWVSGETPGCACLICDRVPHVLARLTTNSEMTPKDVLPLTTLPRLHEVVDEMLQPDVKFVLGSQGRIGENKFQEYPSAAVGHTLYPKSSIDVGATIKLSKNLDPKQILDENNAPKNYMFAKGIFWENGKDMMRSKDDPDQHAFGFVYVKEEKYNKGSNFLGSEFQRFQPRTSND